MAKIVIDARESGTSTGRYIDKLIEHLHELQPEHEIVVLAKPARVDFIKEMAPNFKVLESNFKEFTFAEQLGFKKQLDGLKADLVHFGMTQQPVRYRGRHVTTVHDLTTLRFTNPDKLELVFKFKQRIYAKVVKRAAQSSRFVIVPSQFVKDDLVSYTGVNPAKVVVTYEAADPIPGAAEPIKNLIDRKFLLYVGRPAPHKNLLRLVEAFALIKHQYHEASLIMAGKKDANYQRLEQYVIEKGVQGVYFVGFVSESQLKWLYENCAAYVFPSLSEGFGLPGLEAMVHGAPVVASRATCLPEIYGNAAHYFDPLNVEAMAVAINQVLSDKPKQLREELIANGKQQAAKYSWKRMAEQTLEVYEKALGDAV